MKKMIVLLLCIVPFIARADGLSVSIENDIFTGSDNNYSHATELKWNMGSPGETVFLTSYGARQAFYTPEDISTPLLHAYDRNYCGTLEGFVQFWRKDHLLTGDEYALYEIDLGVLGPLALGHEIQSYAHRIMPGNIQPQGWSQQYPNEPIFNIYMERHNGIATVGSKNGWSSRTEVVHGASAGTTWVNMFAGAETKLGWNIPDFTSDGVFPMKAVKGSFEPESGFFAYLRISTRQYSDMHNATLGESMFHDNANTRQPMPFFNETTYGLIAGYRSFSLSYLLTHRSLEFYGQSHGMDYGTVALNFGTTF